MDLDPCADQMMEDLGTSGLFDLSRVCFSYIILFRAICSLFYSNDLTLGIGAYEVATRQGRRLGGGNPSVLEALKIWK